MKYLRDALKNFIDFQVSQIKQEQEADERYRPDTKYLKAAIDLKLFKVLIDEYKLHFVEPEDDKEFQDWQDVCFPRS